MSKFSTQSLVHTVYNHSLRVFSRFSSQDACRSYQEVTRVHFTIISSRISLLQKSTTRPLTPILQSTWKFLRGAFLFTIHSLCTVQQRTNQIARNDISCSPLARQMPGLSWALWEKSSNFGVRWTGTDIVPQWCEEKPASFPGWKPFQCHFRFRLHPKV